MCIGLIISTIFWIRLQLLYVQGKIYNGMIVILTAMCAFPTIKINVYSVQVIRGEINLIKQSRIF